MEYRAVGRRCAVDMDSLQLPISREETLSILAAKKFKVVEVDIISQARSCIGVSLYRRGARLFEAPATFDCSGFIKWLYGQSGVWLPRRSIQQRQLGEIVEISQVTAGDAVFVSSWTDYYINDPADGVGHVGIATVEKTVIHAANRQAGVIESSFEEFVGVGKFRGVRRYIPQDRYVVILETPVGREVETADDVRWIVLQSLSK